jgi:hypothetical protein
MRLNFLPEKQVRSRVTSPGDGCLRCMHPALPAPDVDLDQQAPSLAMNVCNFRTLPLLGGNMFSYQPTTTPA